MGFLIFILGSAAIFVFASCMSGVVPFRGYFLQYLFGYTKIKLYDGQYHFNEDFITWVKFYDSIDEYDAYRYTSTKIGSVKIRKNGTAEYCGEYKWRYA